MTSCSPSFFCTFLYSNFRVPSAVCCPSCLITENGAAAVWKRTTALPPPHALKHLIILFSDSREGAGGERGRGCFLQRHANFLSLSTLAADSPRPFKKEGGGTRQSGSGVGFNTMHRCFNLKVCRDLYFAERGGNIFFKERCWAKHVF